MTSNLIFIIFVLLVGFLVWVTLGYLDALPEPVPGRRLPPLQSEYTVLPGP